MVKLRTRTPRPAVVPEPAPRDIMRRFPQVTRIVDAKRPIRVVVDTEDGESGVSTNSDECALARALCRAFHAKHAVVGMSSTTLIKKNLGIRFATPERVRREIVSYDRHHDFEPGEYVLHPHRPSQRLGARSSSGSAHTKAPTRDTRERHDKASKQQRVLGTARVRWLASKEGVVKGK